MNILLTGAAGQLGTELIPLLTARGNLVVTDRNPPIQKVQHWKALDLSNGAGVEKMLNETQPGLIVNTAAYTAVDQAEDDVDTSFDVNAEFPGRLAHWAKKNDAILIHYSTDYVFNGRASVPYLETDATDPQSVYGQSKLAGEQAISRQACRHTILRTSWVYSSHGKNFVLSMLNLALKGKALSVVNDQKGCPTWAGSLARASDAVIEHWKNANDSGVFHYCDDRALTWFEFANEIFDRALRAGLIKMKPDMQAVTSSEFPQPAARPHWSVLDTAKIHDVYNIKAASFVDSLQTVVDEVKTRGTI